MKSFHDTIRRLLQINFFTALIALVFFALIRGQQSVLTGTQQEKSRDNLTYRGQIQKQSSITSKQEQITPEVVTLNQYQQLERQLKALERQILSEKIGKNANLSLNSSRLTPNNHQKGQPIPPASPKQSANLVIPTLFPLAVTPPRIVSSQVSYLDPSTNTTNQSKLVFANPTVIEDNHSLELILSNQNNELATANQADTTRTIAVKPADSENSSRQTHLAASPVPASLKKSVSINLAVTPPPERSAEISQEPEKKNPSTPEKVYSLTESKMAKEELIGYANDISAGLLVAGNNGQINYGTTNYRRVQTAIVLLRQGEDIENAARRAKVSLDTLQQLIKWGENRPGSLTASTADSISPKNWN
jgi:hypothetical protein